MATQTTQFESPSASRGKGPIPHYTLIGSKLDDLFAVPRDESDAIAALLLDLEHKLAR